MQKLLSLLPPRLKNFLLTQPLPDAWLDALRHELDVQPSQTEGPLCKPDDLQHKPDNPAAPQGTLLELHAGWRESYSLLLALVVLILGGLVVYLIMS